MATKKTEVKTVFNADTKAYTEAINKCKIQTTKFKNDLRLLDTQLKSNSNSSTSLTDKKKLLENQLINLDKQIENQNNKLNVAKKLYGEDSEEVRKLTNQLTNSKTARQNVLNQLEDTESKIKKLNIANSEYTKSMKECDNKLLDLKKSLEINKNEYSTTSDKVANLKERQTLLNNELDICKEKINLTKNELNKFGTETDENKEEVENLKNILKETQVEYSNINSQLNQTTKELKENHNAFNTAAKSTKEFGNNLKQVGDALLPLSAISGGILVGATKAAIDYEDAFAGVNKTVDGTPEQMEKLSNQIKSMAEVIPSSTTELSNIAEAAGQLGIEIDNIGDFTKVMSMMGTATNLSATEAASSLAKFANVTNMSQKDFDKLGSVIVDLGNKFATTEADIVSMAERLAGAGAQAGLSEADILGISTALSSVGIAAEMGGSAFSKAIIKMYNSVELGGNQLNNVLNKSHMSLKQLQLLASNNSSDFKSLANQLGMTSEELKKIIQAGVDLENFSEISGMTAKQFQKAWKDDATQAISAFITGLGKAQEEGSSSIAMLTEMGITEIRLRDTLLRSSNAQELFNKAVETGRNAWTENNALTNEAEKKYKTMASQLQLTKNKFNNLAINLGNQVLPYLNKLIDGADKLVSWFSKLSDGTQKFIVKALTFTTVTGAMASGTGRLIQNVSPAVDVIGKLFTKVSSVTGAVSSASSATSLLSTAIGALTSPTGLAVAGITTLVGVGTSLYLKATESERAIRKESEAIKAQTEEIIKSKEEQAKLTETKLYSIDIETQNIQRLYNELQNITNSNGEIKKGYEDRAATIVSTLNQELNLDMQVSQNKVKGLNEAGQAIEDYILKKKGQLILESLEQDFTNKMTQYREAYAKAEELYNDYINESDEKQKEKKKQNYLDALNNANEFNTSLAYYYDTEKKVLEGHYSSIYQTESDYVNSLKINAEEVSQLRKASQEELKAMSDEELIIRREKLTEQQNIAREAQEQAQLNYDLSLEAAEKYGDAIWKDQVERNKKILYEEQSKYQRLYEQIKETDPIILQAYKDTYEQQLNWMSGQQYRFEQIGKNQIKVYVDGMASQQTYTIDELKKFIDNQINSLDKKNQLWMGQGSKFGHYTIEGYKEAMNDPKQREIIEKATTNFVNSSIKAPFENSLEINSPSRYTKRLAGYTIDGFSVGLSDSSKKNALVNKAKSLANSVLTTMKKTLGINSPSTETQQYSKFLTEGYSIGLENTKKPLLNNIDKLTSDMKKHLDLDFDSSYSINQLVNKNVSTNFTSSNLNKFLENKNISAEAMLNKMNAIINQTTQIANKDWDMYINKTKITDAIKSENDIVMADILDKAERGVAY